MRETEYVVIAPGTVNVLSTPRRVIAATIRPVAVLVAAVVMPAAFALALLPFRSQAPAATVALGFAVLVSLLAAAGTRLSALIAALGAGASSVALAHR